MRSCFTGIAGPLRPSFVDFPGTVSAVLFYVGCNLRCPYCHNPSLVASGGVPLLPSEEVRDYLMRRRDWLGGVVLSGGEPTIHPTAPAAAAAARELGYRVKLDTNGLLPRTIEEIAPDYLALDIKTLPSLYTSLLGAHPDNVEKNLLHSLDQARERGDHAEVRITVAPGIVTRDVIEKLGPRLAGIRRVYLQPMQQRTDLLDPAWRGVKPVDMKEIELFRELLAPYADFCGIRGKGNERGGSITSPEQSSPQGDRAGTVSGE